MHAPVGAELQAQAQGRLGLRRAHRHRHDLPVDRVAEAGGVLHRGGVERVELERNAFALQRLRLVVELDRVGTRHLLDEHDDLHGAESIEGDNPGSC